MHVHKGSKEEGLGILKIGLIRNYLASHNHGVKSFINEYSQIWPALPANFLTLRVWERTGAIQDDKYLKWQ